jgi:hypothetical protein
MQDHYLESAKRQFRTYRGIAEKAMAQIPEDGLFYQFNAESNSIATIVKHLHGNMLSRWTDFLTSDGEKEWRNRDGEFENDIQSKADVMALWDAGWECLEQALAQLSGADLDRTIHIRGEGHSAMEAINRQMAHYAYHVGQIVFVAKILVQGDWVSMSIPKNKSAEFNQKMFGK